jgi:hypothetical protein
MFKYTAIPTLDFFTAGLHTHRTQVSSILTPNFDALIAELQRETSMVMIYYTTCGIGNGLIYHA